MKALEFLKTQGINVAEDLKDFIKTVEDVEDIIDTAWYCKNNDVNSDMLKKFRYEVLEHHVEFDMSVLPSGTQWWFSDDDSDIDMTTVERVEFDDGSVVLYEKDC